MALFPEVARKAQAEIDAVVGPDRLPGFIDRQNLPYLNAVVTEALRWHTVIPLCMSFSLLLIEWHGLTERKACLIGHLRMIPSEDTSFRRVP